MENRKKMVVEIDHDTRTIKEKRKKREQKQPGKRKKMGIRMGGWMGWWISERVELRLKDREIGRAHV